MPDPFDLSQYVTSFKKVSEYTPQTFEFANFDTIFSQVAEAIRMRQAGVSIGFAIPENAFLNVEAYDITSPISVADSLERFQDAVREFVQGSLIEEYGKLPNCDIYVGFFHYNSGLPIVGINSIAPNGIDFTAPPDPSEITNIVEFAEQIGSRINEIIYSLNILRNLHAKMYVSYPLDTTCSPPGGPGPGPGPGPNPCPPGNDNCAGGELNVRNLSGVGPFTGTRCVTGSTVCATIDNHGAAVFTSPNVWYTFVIPGPADINDWLVDDYFAIQLTIEGFLSDGSIGPDPNWKITVWDAGVVPVNGCDSLTAISVLNTGNPNQICVKRRHKYILSVYHATPDAVGNFTLCYKVVLCSPSPPPPPPPPVKKSPY